MKKIFIVLFTMFISSVALANTVTDKKTYNLTDQYHIASLIQKHINNIDENGAKTTTIFSNVKSCLKSTYQETKGYVIGKNIRVEILISNETHMVLKSMSITTSANSNKVNYTAYVSFPNVRKKGKAIHVEIPNFDPNYYHINPVKDCVNINNRYK